jgi:hypothetical protein
MDETIKYYHGNISDFEEESALSVSNRIKKNEKIILINCLGDRLHFVLCYKCKCTNERIII